MTADATETIRTSGQRPLSAAQPRGPAPKVRSGWRKYKTEYALFLALVAPNLVIIAVFSYWPVIYNAYLSFTSWDMIAPEPIWTGISNYTSMLTDPDFGRVLINTVLFSCIIVAGSLIAGLAIALLFNQKIRGRGLVRTVAFAPHIVSGAAVATLWLFIFDPNYGLSRTVLGAFGVTSPNWTTDSRFSLFALIIVYLWKGIGFSAIVYLAGLQGLPRDLYESAMLDGAGPWAIFRKITLPLLSPVTFFLILTSIISTFQAYDVTAIMTGGGPGISSTTLSWYIYQQAFQDSDTGRSAAAAMVMFVLLLLVTGFQTRYMERKVHYR